MKEKSSKCVKGLVVLFGALFLVLLTGMSCYAKEEETITLTQDGIDEIIDGFEEAIPEEIGEFKDASDVSDAIGLKRLLSNIFNTVTGNSGEFSAFLLMLLGVGLMSALSSVGNTDLGVTASRGVGIVSSALLFERLIFLVTGAVDSLREIGGFFEAVIPISLAVNSLGVSPTTATTQAVGMGVTLGLYSHLAENIVLPVVCAIFVCSAASAIDPTFARISKGIKGTFLWMLGILTALVGATFSLQSVISASADTAAMRSAKYAISGTIPIVGGAVSSALGVLAGGVSYARGLVGGGSVAVILTLILSPMITLLIYRLCLKAGIFFTSICSTGGCADVLSAFLGAFDALIATYAITSVVYIVELVAFMKGGASFA